MPESQLTDLIASVHERMASTRGPEGPPGGGVQPPPGARTAAPPMMRSDAVAAITGALPDTDRNEHGDMVFALADYALRTLGLKSVDELIHWINRELGNAQSAGMRSDTSRFVVPTPEVEVLFNHLRATRGITGRSGQVV